MTHVWTKISDRLPCQQTKKQHVGGLKYLYNRMTCFEMKGKRSGGGELMFIQSSTLYSLMNSAPISSTLCSLRLAVSEVGKQNKYLVGQQSPAMMNALLAEIIE